MQLRVMGETGVVRRTSKDFKSLQDRVNLVTPLKLTEKLLDVRPNRMLGLGPT